MEYKGIKLELTFDELCYIDKGLRKLINFYQFCAFKELDIDYLDESDAVNNLLRKVIDAEANYFD